MGYVQLWCNSEKYQSKPGPTVTILANGLFRFNTKATAMFPPDAQRIFLLVDANGRVRFQVAKGEGAVGSFKLRHFNHGRSSEIGAKSVLTSLGWPKDAESTNMPVKWIERQKAFEGVLPKPTKG